MVEMFILYFSESEVSVTSDKNIFDKRKEICKIIRLYNAPQEWC